MELNDILIKNNDLLESLLELTQKGKKQTKRGTVRQKTTFVDTTIDRTTTDYRPLYDSEGDFGGFFQDCSMEDGLLNLMVHPIMGLANALPVKPNNNIDHAFGFLVRYDIGDEEDVDDRSSACGPCIPVTSTLNFCKMSAAYGQFCRSIHTMDITQLILRACQNQFDQFYVIGNWRGVSDEIPFGSIGSDSELIKALAMNRKLYELGIVLQRWILKNVWVGDPALNPAPDGSAFPGNFFGILKYINGDYPTSGLPISCATGGLADTSALNSIVVDAAGSCVGDGTINLYHMLQEIEQELYMKASQTGMLPVEWRIYMISPLWREITKFMPCEMALEGCSSMSRVIEVQSTSGNGLDFATIQAREQMKREQSIELNGRMYPVFIDDTMPYTLDTSNNQFKYTSTLAIIPFSAAGGEQTIYWEHLDYSQIYQELGALNGQDKWTGYTDTGYYWHNVVQERNCLDITTEATVRLIFKTPQLAARIDNLGACVERRVPLYFDGAGNPTGALAS